MVSIEALKELAAKVEQAEFDQPPGRYAPLFNSFMNAAENALPDDSRGLLVVAWKAYEGSLDAAKALHDAVLPEWVYGLNFDAYDEKYAFVSDGDYETDEQYSDTHARAWLLAILRALIAQAEA